MGRKWWLLLGWIWAQVLPDTLDAGRWELLLEDQAEQAPEGIDWTQVSDIYETFVRQPVDLNRASDEILLKVPGMTSALLKALRAHQARYGPLLSIYELQAVPGFTEYVYQTIRPYVTVRPATELDIGEGPTQLPSFSQVREVARLTVIQRVQRTWRAFYEAGTWRAETLRSALGDPYRLYNRIWLQANPYLSVALISEKDPFEELRWSPERRYYGYDYISGHIAIGQVGNLRRLILGDYILQVGQGLVFARGLGFGKGGDPIISLKQPSYGLVPYTSVNEYQFWRGAATTVRLSDRLSITGMASRLRQDGTLATSADTTEEEGQFVQTLLTSGLHRTPSELARRGTLLHEAAGGILTWQKRWNSAGATFLYQRFAPPLDLGGRQAYRYFGFAGSENTVGSLFWDFTIRNLNFFGEAAQSRSGGRALTASVITPLHTTLDIAVQVRHFDPDFHSFYAYTFAERPFSIQNEQGVYLGVRVRPHSRWEVTAFHDLYRFPWYRYRANSPTEGHESLIQVTYTIRRRLQAYVRVRHETKPYNISSAYAEGLFYQLVPHVRTYIRAHTLYEINPFWRYQARIEVSRYSRETRSGGYLFYQDVRWQPDFRWSVSLRWVIYRISSYDARIYTYEAMPPTTFFIPGYYGEGQRAYILIRTRLGRQWTIWMRVGQNLFLPPQSRQFRRSIEALLQVRFQIG
ncbi:MAG: helix-hairpin-helix domain-containing protein [Bacteroidia bacterium]|nr:helix-hairpin-helix domain-containing protein [Bacteroidia bacterium]MDW8015190.1 helix-hairpin-helix domain-containing protein [Bacteroidia bacterium]